MKHFFIFFLTLFFISPSFSADLRGRLGIGATNQLANELPAISFKIQTSKTMGLGGLFGLKSDENQSLYGAGVKFYRIIFDEPQLNFYFAGLFAMQNFVNNQNNTESGYQADGTLGTEFHFSGLESLGFSFEFGISARNTDPEAGQSIETLGDHLIKAGVHFYL
jgi:hypothetical protein